MEPLISKEEIAMLLDMRFGERRIKNESFEEERRKPNSDPRGKDDQNKV